MSYQQIYAMATEGMHIEQTRLALVANNIANQHAVKTPSGELFKPALLQTTQKPFSEWIKNTQSTGIDSIHIQSQELPPNKVWQPSHPLADEAGFITKPGMSMVDEMITLQNASHIYEAHVKIFNSAHGLFNLALSIGEER